MQRPPAFRSQMRRIGPAADNATVPDGRMRTCSTGEAPGELAPMRSSHWPVRESKSLMVVSYEPVRTRWGFDGDTWPERT